MWWIEAVVDRKLSLTEMEVSPICACLGAIRQGQFPLRLREQSYLSFNGVYQMLVHTTGCCDLWMCFLSFTRTLNDFDLSDQREYLLVSYFMFHSAARTAQWMHIAASRG